MWRFNYNTNPCDHTHALSIVNALGTNLATTYVTAVSTSLWSGAFLNSPTYPTNGWLTLPGAANTNYYLLSQEINGGDYWYTLPTFICNNVSYFVAQGATISTNLSNFTVYANTVGESFGPVEFHYFIYPHSGTLSMPGGNTNGLNQCMNTNGGSQYKVAVFEVSSFPNQLK